MAACVRMCRMKISRPWPMPGLQRARPAGPEHAYPRSDAKLPYLAISFLEIAHWSILLRGIEGHGEDLDENGCFTSRTCVLRLDRYGSSGYFFFEKHSLIDFQIGKGRKRDFPRGRAAIFSTQRILRGRDPILSIQRIFKRDDVTVV